MSKMKWLRVILLILVAQALLVSQGQCSNIILKTMVVNPSKTQTQDAILKAYLPKEVNPEDVVGLGDLKIDYDIEKGLYYIFKKFELAPGESASRSIEIKDIWVISKAEMEALTGEAKSIVEKLKKTPYFDAAVVLQKDIEEKASEVLAKQEKAMDALPQTHIAVYRGNIKTLDSMKDKLAKLDEMLLKVKVSDPEHAAEKVSVKATWWLILAVIISLGLLSFAFYIIWQRQATIVEKKEKEEDSEKVS